MNDDFDLDRACYLSHCIPPSWARWRREAEEEERTRIERIKQAEEEERTSIGRIIKPSRKIYNSFKNIQDYCNETPCECCSLRDLFVDCKNGYSPAFWNLDRIRNEE